MQKTSKEKLSKNQQKHIFWMVIGSVDLVFYFPLETANHLPVMGNMI
jgi:hypothetical protein